MGWDNHGVSPVSATWYILSMFAWGYDDIHVLKIYNTWSTERYEDAEFDLPDLTHISRLASGEYSIPLHKAKRTMRAETMGELVQRLSLHLTSLLSQHEIGQLQQGTHSSNSVNNTVRLYNSPQSKTFDPSVTVGSIALEPLSITKRLTDKSILSVIRDRSPKSKTYESIDDEERTMIENIEVVTREYVLKSLDEAAFDKIICLNDDMEEVSFDLNGLNDAFVEKMKRVVEDGKKRKREVKVVVATQDGVDTIADVFIRSTHFEE